MNCARFARTLMSFPCSFDGALDGTTTHTMIRSLPLLAALFIVAACRDAPSPRETRSSSNTAQTRATTATLTASAADGVAAWSDPSCETDTTRSTLSASALVHEYVARNDSLGYFIGGSKANDAWVLQMAECPGHLGGDDSGAVTAHFAVDSLGTTPDSAHYRVRYEVVGALEPTDTTGLRFVPGARVDSQAVIAVRTPYGWRLSGEVGSLWINARHAASALHLPPAQAALVDSAVRLRRSGSRPDA